MYQCRLGAQICGGNHSSGPSRPSFFERAVDENLVHGLLLESTRLPALESQRDGVGRGRVEAALDLPASLGNFVLVQLHLGLCFRGHGLHPLDQSLLITCADATVGRQAAKTSRGTSPAAMVFLNR